MPCHIRRGTGEQFTNFVEIAPGEWRLTEQVDALESWLVANRNKLDKSEEWVADIGFCVRPDAAGGGPVIRKKLMEMCLETNMEVLFSEYPREE